MSSQNTVAEVFKSDLAGSDFDRQRAPFNPLVSSLETTAIQVFKTNLPEFYSQCSPLVNPLISFLVNNVYLDLGNDDLPRWSQLETEQQTDLRHKIISYLMTGLREEFHCTFFDQNIDQDIFTIVLYWYLKDPAAVGIRESIGRKDRKHTRSTSFFQQYTKFTFEQSAHIAERNLAYCPPNAPMTIPWDPFPRPGSFYGERDPQTKTLTREEPEDESEDESLCSPEKFLVPKETPPFPVDHSPMALDPLIKNCDTDNEVDDDADNQNDEEAEAAIQQELTRKFQKYLVRKQRQTRLGQQVEFIISSADERTGRLERVDSSMVLEHMLQKTGEMFPHRYGDMLSRLGTPSIHDILKAALTSNTTSLLEILDSGPIGLNELIKLGGNPENDDGPGIYLHILWTQGNKFSLYVGQSLNMRERVGRHCDKEYRRNHPSLHYSLWYSGNIVGDVFVTLAKFNPLSHFGVHLITPEDYALLLNLEEMFMACVLQTLRSVDLAFFLANDAPKPWAGMHLNVALPLFQGFTGGDGGEPVTRQTFSDALHSPNSDIRKWAKRCRDSFNDLRNSPDSQLREYWLGKLEEARILAAASKKPRQAIPMYYAETKKLQRFQDILSSGALVKTRKQTERSTRFSWGWHTFHLPKRLNFPFEVVVGDEVLFRPLLFDSPRDLPYARNALPTDPASRLMIAVRIQKGGEDHWRWLSVYSDVAVEYMNHFVDCLEGLSLTQSKLLPRRKIHVNRGRKRKRDPVKAPEEPLDHISSKVGLGDDSEDNSDGDLPASKKSSETFSQELEEATLEEIEIDLYVDELELEGRLS